MAISKNDMRCVEKYVAKQNKRFSNVEFGFGINLWENLIPIDEYFNMVSNYAVVKKDVKDDDVLKIISIDSISNGMYLNVLTDSHLNIEIDLRKEIEYFRSNWDNNITCVTDVVEYLEENRDILNKTNITINLVGGRIIGSLWSSYVDNKKSEFDSILRDEKQIKRYGKSTLSLDECDKVYTCKIISRNEGGFFVDVSGVPAFLPGSLAGANKIIDFESLIGTKLEVMLEDYLIESDTYVVSHKKWLSYILPTKIDGLRNSIMKDKFVGKVTGVAKFGLFVEFDKFFTGLLHFSGMNSKFYSKFRSMQFGAGDEVEFYIKDIDENSRIILCTDNTIILDPWTKFKEQEGQKLIGEIFNITNYGAFVKFNHDNYVFKGLLPFKSLPEQYDRETLKQYQKYEFNIDKVLIEDKRIFLSI